MNKLKWLLAPLALIATMGQAASEQIFYMVKTDLDFTIVDDDLAVTWEGDAWVGGDFNKGWFKYEGEVVGGRVEEAELQALYSRNIARFFDLQMGIRNDFRPNTLGQTTYAVIGLQGLAPYWFEVDIPLFFSEHGDVSFRPEVEYEILLTQRLVAELYFEGNFYLTSNPAQLIGSGLAVIDTGLKFRYEITREFAPYIDFNHIRSFGMAKTQAILSGEKAKDFVVRFGARVLF